MQIKPISFQQYIDSFQPIVGGSIWRVIHPADGWLTIDIGQKYFDTISGKDGNDEPYEKGQYQLHITGDWEVFSENKLVETRKVNEADQKTYFERMEKLATSFPLKTIDSVKFEENKLIISGDGAQIRVPVKKDGESISFTIVELNQSNKPVSYTHYRYEDELQSLAEIKA